MGYLRVKKINVYIKAQILIPKIRCITFQASMYSVPPTPFSQDAPVPLAKLRYLPLRVSARRLRRIHQQLALGAQSSMDNAWRYFSEYFSSGIDCSNPKRDMHPSCTSNSTPAECTNRKSTGNDREESPLCPDASPFLYCNPQTRDKQRSNVQHERAPCPRPKRKASLHPPRIKAAGERAVELKLKILT